MPSLRSSEFFGQLLSHSNENDEESGLNKIKNKKYINYEEIYEKYMLSEMIYEPLDGSSFRDEEGNNYMSQFLQKMRQSNLADNGQMSIEQCLAEIQELQLDLNFFMV